MNDQNDQSNPNQPVTPAQDNNQQPSPAADQPVTPPMPPSPVAEPPAVPETPVAEDPNKDLQSLSKDLENLAQEAVKTTPQAPAAEPASLAAQPIEAVPSQNQATAPATEPAATVPAPEKSTTDAKITVYSTANCPFCKTEKEFLTSQGLQFVEKDVEQDNEALKEMLSLSDNFAGVPVTVLDGPKGKKVVKGFTQEEFEKELSETGLKETSASSKPTAPVEPEAPSEPAAPAEPVAPAEPEAPAEPAVPANEPLTEAPAEVPKVPDLQ